MNRILLVDFNNNLMSLKNVNERKPVMRYLKDLRETIVETKANKVIFLADHGDSDFRMNRFPDYKKARHERIKAENEKKTEAEKKKDIEFFSQVKFLRETLAPHFGIELVRFEGQEADDSAAFLVNHTDLTQHQLLNLSSDADWRMLLRKNVIQRPMYGGQKLPNGKLEPKVWLTRSKFVDGYGFEPHILAHVKALNEISDNLQNISGLGEGTALKLIQQYGSIQNLEKNVHNIKQDIPKVRQSVVDGLTSNFDLVYFNYDLVNLNYTEEIKNEIFSKKVQESLNETISNFTVKPKINREAIEDYLLECGEVNILVDLDNWLRPFTGEH